MNFNRVFHYKPSILGYRYFWKHPYNWVWWYVEINRFENLENLDNDNDMMMRMMMMMMMRMMMMMMMKSKLNLFEHILQVVNSVLVASLTGIWQWPLCQWQGGLLMGKHNVETSGDFTVNGVELTFPPSSWFLSCFFPVFFTPLKINMEHNHGGLEDHFPF